MAEKTVDLFSAQKWDTPINEAIQQVYDEYGPANMFKFGVEVNLHDQAYRQLGQPDVLVTEFGPVKVRTGEPTITARLNRVKG